MTRLATEIKHAKRYNIYTEYNKYGILPVVIYKGIRYEFRTKTAAATFCKSIRAIAQYKEYNIIPSSKYCAKEAKKACKELISVRRVKCLYMQK